MRDRRDLVVQALTEPAQQLSRWSAPQWTRLCQQARSAGLLARVGLRLRALWGGDDRPPWPDGLDGHLDAAMRLLRAQRAEVERELGHIARALAGLSAPVVVLKGAAYHAAGLPPADSRLFSDVDILVPREVVGEAESLLMLAGWVGTHDSDYDQRYYREWMHELPPMQHIHRGTTLDLHHNILPITARLKPDGALLVERAVRLAGYENLHVLAAEDMVLHSMTHLFMNEEMSHALRDLSDLDLLLRHFGTEPDFWERLLARAVQLDLGRPLHYGVRHAMRTFGTPVPTGAASRADGLGPPWPRLMDAIWHRALRAPHPSSAARGTAAARFMLYVRGHWLRMPPWLLARHLTVKALRLHARARTPSVTAPTEG
jgi:hypothetical protein